MLRRPVSGLDGGGSPQVPLGSSLSCTYAFPSNKGIIFSPDELVCLFPRPLEKRHFYSWNCLHANTHAYAHAQTDPQRYAAQSNLGAMYDKGEGVKQDYAEAVEWYRRAAEQRGVDAQSNLGSMYLTSAIFFPECKIEIKSRKEVANC